MKIHIDTVTEWESLCFECGNTENLTRISAGVSVCSKCLSESDYSIVDIIISECKWTCPYCNFLNKENGVKEMVVCNYCTSIYYVDDIKYG